MNSVATLSIFSLPTWMIEEGGLLVPSRLMADSPIYLLPAYSWSVNFSSHTVLPF
jgi:hypothetical protein